MELWVVQAAVLFLLVGCEVARGQAPSAAQSPAGDLTQVSIENLMNVEVTSVSKKEQKLSQVAAAVYVITQEDIRHSGATNIPDLLRMVPGLDVAQINANTWAISSRGFNSEFANKLLVLIDGRTVYTPLFGGANWDTFDVPLEDIDRIEVIRGPGGTIWGANAVNGVINVITKKTEDTLGGLVTTGGGTAAQEFGTVQYGGKIQQDTSYRIFAKYLNGDHFPDLNGTNGEDGWHLLHGGFREDTRLSAKDSLTTQGDLYAGSEGSTIVHTILNPPENVEVQRLTPLSGGNVLGKWNHIFSDRADMTMQIYFDRYTRSGPEVRETRNTYDFEFQNHLVWGNRQDVIWGFGYRHSADQTLGTIDEAFAPADWDGDLFSAFVQDQITVRPDRVFLSIGTKLENSYFTGFDLQPSIRVAWTPNKRHTFWASISRAARTPARRDEGVQAAGQSTISAPAIPPTSIPLSPVSAIPAAKLPAPRTQPPRPRATTQPKQTFVLPNYVVPLFAAFFITLAIFALPKILSHRPNSSSSTTSAASQPASETKPVAQPPRTESPKPAKPAGQTQISPKSAAVKSPADQPRPSQTVATPSAASLRTDSFPSVNAPASSNSSPARGEVLDQVLPEVSDKARSTIHGTVRVAVRVHVDPAGNVASAELDAPGPSSFFADLALKAARRWEFTSPEVNGHSVPSEWLIHFHITSSGTKAIPTQTAP